MLAQNLSESSCPPNKKIQEKRSYNGLEVGLNVQNRVLSILCYFYTREPPGRTVVIVQASVFGGFPKIGDPHIVP